MALPLHTTVTISCEASEEESGPTIVHSTGVQNYRISPELIRVLQESCSNEKLCDNEKGVQCTDPPAHILQTLKHAGFSITAKSKSGSRKIWMLTKTSESGDEPEHEEQDNEEEEEDQGDEE